MCMIEFGDGPVTMLSQADPVARKPHKCNECGRQIEIRERYHVDRFVWEGKLETHKTCAHCVVARNWLNDECGGWIYGEVLNDFREHVAYGGYPMAVARIAIGMRWQWRSPAGRLLPIPGAPPTTHEMIKPA
jgi:hypothetical protein